MAAIERIKGCVDMTRAYSTLHSRFVKLTAPKLL